MILFTTKMYKGKIVYLKVKTNQTHVKLQSVTKIHASKNVKGTQHSIDNLWQLSIDHQ